MGDQQGLVVIALKTISEKRVKVFMVCSRFLSLILMALMLVFVSAPASAAKILNYRIDTERTKVNFTWTRFGLTMPGAAFTQVSGNIIGDMDAPEKSSATVVIPVKSLDTHITALNRHLIESGDYFKAKEFPNIVFKSIAIKSLDKKMMTFTLHGELTINGITKPVVLDTTLNKFGPDAFYGNAQAVNLSASAKIKRSDFGIDKLIPIVSDEMTVKITVEAVDANAESAEKIAQDGLEKAKADKTVSDAGTVSGASK
jgi:polyisoprenoid-binding protein YceI